jgi:hypothetical protein
MSEISGLTESVLVFKPRIFAQLAVFLDQGGADNVNYYMDNINNP